jgi:hypothetical protein
MPVQMLPYCVHVSKVTGETKFDGTQGVKAKVLATQFGIYTITIAYLLPEDQSKYAFARCLTPFNLDWAVTSSVDHLCLLY